MMLLNQINEHKQLMLALVENIKQVWEFRKVTNNGKENKKIIDLSRQYLFLSEAQTHSPTWKLFELKGLTQ